MQFNSGKMIVVILLTFLGSVCLSQLSLIAELDGLSPAAVIRSSLPLLFALFFCALVRRVRARRTAWDAVDDVSHGLGQAFDAAPAPKHQRDLRRRP